MMPGDGRTREWSVACDGAPLLSPEKRGVMQVSKKELHGAFDAIADAIASADIDQEDRERLAQSIAERVDFRKFGIGRDLFVLLASDPLVPCAGHGDEPCPDGRVIRIRMHLSSAPDGRSAAWEPRAPYGKIRCISCGAKEFVAA